jgi:hypothetical protein
MKYRTTLHRQIRKGQRWRRRFKTGEPLNWYEDFARRWQQLERDVIPIMQKLIKQFSDMGAYQ